MTSSPVGVAAEDAGGTIRTVGRPVGCAAAGLLAAAALREDDA